MCDSPQYIAQWERFLSEIDVPDFYSQIGQPYVLAIAENYAAAWTDLGDRYPETEEYYFFNRYFDDVQSVLAAGLASEDQKTRECSARVIEPIARRREVLVDEIVAVLRTEDTPLVRQSLCVSLADMQTENPAALEVVREIFHSLKTNEMRLYEALHAAAALFTLSNDPVEKSEAADFVCNYLVLSSPCTDREESICRSAIQVVSHMPGCQKAIPYLQQLRQQRAGENHITGPIRYALNAAREGSTE